MNESGKISSFSEYAQAFPAGPRGYLASKALTDAEFIPKNCLTTEDAIKLAEDRVLTGVSSGPSNVLATTLWLEVASIYLHEGLLDDAEASCLQALRNNEVFVPIFATFGRIEEARGNPEAAITFYRRGISIDPEDLNCLLGLIRLLRDTTPFEAENHARSLLNLDPELCEAWSHLGMICARTGREAEAQLCFEKAMKSERQIPLRSFGIISLITSL